MICDSAVKGGDAATCFLHYFLLHDLHEAVLLHCAHRTNASVVTASSTPQPPLFRLAVRLAKPWGKKKVGKERAVKVRERRGH